MVTQVERWQGGGIVGAAVVASVISLLLCAGVSAEWALLEDSLDSPTLYL
jgi:hypothetical protein